MRSQHTILQTITNYNPDTIKCSTVWPYGSYQNGSSLESNDTNGTTQEAHQNQHHNTKIVISCIYNVDIEACFGRLFAWINNLDIC